MNDPAPPNSGHAGHTHGHGWMMMICCIPMIVIAIALVASGTVNASFLLFAAMCAGMMFMMMRMMGGMAGSTRESHQDAHQPPDSR